MNAYFARWRTPAANKPKISSLSQEFGVLILFLCLASFETGIFFEDILFRRAADTQLGIGLAALGMGMLGWLATQFRWSGRTTFCLRVASGLAAIAVMIFICWHVCTHPFGR